MSATVRELTLPSAVQAALQELKQALLRMYGDRFGALYLYGSYARGTAHPDSDIDVLIALKGEVKTYVELNRLSEAVAKICLDHDVLIATYPVPEAWLSERRSPLLDNVRREGVSV